MNTLTLSLLGEPQLAWGDSPLAGLPLKGQALLCYLAVQKGQASRQRLAGLLWSDQPEEEARRNLRALLTACHTALPGALLATRATIGLDPAFPRWLDVDAFERGLESPDLDDQLQAAALARGEFLSGFFVRGAALFEEWVLVERECLHQEAINSFLHLARRAEPTHPPRAIELLRQTLRLEPWWEDAHRLLIELLARHESRTAALRQYEICRQSLADGLGVEPSPETQSLAHTLRQAPPHPLTPSPLPPLSPAPSLPSPLTPFIGRQTELTELTALLADPECRLITLLGPGGVGKTRLALQLAARQAETFADGACFAALEALQHSAEIPLAVGAALGMAFRSDQPADEQLLAALRPKALLLILDNCEHLDAAPWALRLLQHAPHLKILATSRQPLELSGEWHYPVAGLPLPEADSPAETSQAVQLFAQRARRMDLRFDLAANLPAVAEICRLVDGLPLGIELAAARVRWAACQQIAGELAASLDALHADLRDLPERHRSLRHTLDWSYNRLAPAEQKILRQLAVYPGGWTAALNPAISDAVLARLVNQSLVAIERRPRHAVRYRLLVPIRQYALEKLHAAGEFAAASQQHLAALCAFAEQAAPALLGPDQFEWIARLDEERDNFSAALAWAIRPERFSTAHGQAGTSTRSEAADEPGTRENLSGLAMGLRLATALREYWGVRGYLREGEAWLEKLLALAAAETFAGERAHALATAANLAFWRNAYPLARQRAETALEIFCQLNDLPDQAFCLRLLGQAIGLQESGQRREFDLAQRHLQASAEIYRRLEDVGGLAEALGWQGMLLGISGDFAAGERLMLESIALCRRVGHARGVALRASDLANLYLRQARFAEAQPLLEDALAIQRRLGRSATVYLVSLLGNVALNQRQAALARQRLGEAAALADEFGLTQLGLWNTCHLGYACLQLGELAEAERHFAESLRRFAESDQQSGVIYAVEGFASLSARRGEWERTARLYAWADATRGRIGDPRPPVEQSDVGENLRQTRENLSMQAFQQASADGKTGSLEKAMGWAF